MQISDKKMVFLLIFSHSPSFLCLFQAERPGWKLKLRVEDIDIGDITYGTCNDVLHVYDQNTNTGVPLVIAWKSWLPNKVELYHNIINGYDDNANIRRRHCNVTYNTASIRRHCNVIVRWIRWIRWVRWILFGISKVIREQVSPCTAVSVDLISTRTT